MTRQLEKVLLNKVYQLGLRRVIALLSANDDLLDVDDMNSTESVESDGGTEHIVGIAPKSGKLERQIETITPPSEKEEKEDDEDEADEPEVPDDQITVSPEDRREIVKNTWAALVQFAE